MNNENAITAPQYLMILQAPEVSDETHKLAEEGLVALMRRQASLQEA